MNPPKPVQRRTISVLITVEPAPVKGIDEFNLTATSATEGFTVDQPVVMGQYPRNGGQSLTILVRVYPSPPPPPAAPAVPWWLVKPHPGKFGRSVRRARELAGLSQAGLARQTGLSEMTIRNVDSGVLACSAKTRTAVLEALARAGQEVSTADPEPQHEETEDKK